MATVSSQEAVPETNEWTKPPFLRRVRIQGYKSIAFCDVNLQPLTILVGRNAAGKSNFLDALAFLRDCMEVGVAEAVKRRGGWSSIVSRTSPHNRIAIEIEAAFEGWISNVADASPSQSSPVPLLAHYAIEVTNPPNELPKAVIEKLRISNPKDESAFILDFDHGKFTFDTQGMKPDSLQWIPPSVKVNITRLEPFFLRAIGQQPFVVLGDRLRSMGFYNFHPDAIRALSKPNPGWVLEQDGGNLASVIESLREIEPESVERVRDYLRVIVDDVQDFNVVRYGEYETVRFRLRGEDVSSPVEFDAASMSDGTLRVLAALVAGFQIVLPHGHPSVIGIEEPEAALHPAAMRALVDALDEATQWTQVLLTTHSADLLSDPDITPGQVLVVRNRRGQTQITPLGPASREIVKKELNSLAELQRMDRLDIDESDLRRQAGLHN